MIITKRAETVTNDHRQTGFFKNARSAFRAYLRSLDMGPDELVLLPGYIGWSHREGSGVFDPVRELGLGYAFYRMDADLHIDLGSLRSILQRRRARLVVIIHYFGFVDPRYHEAAAMAREYGALVLEDQAHALYTDFIGGVSGHEGDACIFSLHKMLPLDTGGLLCLKTPAPLPEEPGVEAEARYCTALTGYDLQNIAAKRIRNAEALARALDSAHDLIRPLRPVRNNGEVPQTYPVLVDGVSRDRLYDLMNSKGFGVVTLYHTLIEQIDRAEHPDAHALARTILNLPVHQDAGTEQMKMLVDQLLETVRSMREGPA